MAMKLLIATQNPNKVREIKELLFETVEGKAGGKACARVDGGADRGSSLRAEADDSDMIFSAEFLGADEPVEDGASFEENAEIKAKYYYDLVNGSDESDTETNGGTACLADDSGLSVDIMGEAPGVLSARWAGVHRADEDNNRLLLAQMKDLPARLRGAKFVCSLCLIVPSPTGSITWKAEGEIKGEIGTRELGENGFGYDSLFYPDIGGGRSFAEFSPEEKNKVSHRAKAVEKLSQVIKEILEL